MAAVVPHLAWAVDLAVVAADPGRAPEADLDVYHVANEASHGFVYRALGRRPGLVVLEDWGLHALVHAETAGRGDEAGYRREARRAHGETGAFVARQVLRGLGGALPALLALNDRVLEACLGLVATSRAVHERAAKRLVGRPVVHLPLASADPARAAGAFAALAREVAPGRAVAWRALEAARAREATPVGRAMVELRPLARELGLADVPAGVEPLLAGVLPQSR